MRPVSVAAVGTVSDPGTFSGTPYHFWATARKMGYDLSPWEMDLTRVNNRRKTWNFQQLLKLHKPGGFQYSNSFANMVIDQIPERLLSSDVISFNQHFPPASVIAKHKGRIFHYIDATFSQLAERYGVGKTMDQRTIGQIIRKEKTFFEQAEHIFTMQQWARDSVTEEYGIDPSKVSAVLPGANILFPDDYEAKVNPKDRFDRENPLVLGFVGKDWKRKGLLVLAAIRDALESRGYPVVIRCAGNAPPEFASRRGVEFAGFIDKYKDYSAFIRFLESCDVGCLFSEAEFSSISILEFLATARPVAGYVVDGMGDLFLPDASMRFNVTDDIKKITDVFEKFITDKSYRDGLNTSAKARSEYVRWPRAVKEVMSILNVQQTR